MDLCKEVNEQLEAELQKQITKLSDQEGHKKIYENQSEEIRQLMDVLKELHCCLEDEQKLLRDSEAQISSLRKQNTELENAAQETEVKFLYFFSGNIYLLSSIICFFPPLRPSGRLKLGRSTASWNGSVSYNRS